MDTMSWLSSAILPAPPSESPSGLDIIEDWLDRATDALHEWGAARQDAAGDGDGLFLDVAWSAFELLAAHGGLRRLTPDILEDRRSALQMRVDAAIEEDRALLAPLIQALPLLDGFEQGIGALKDEEDAGRAAGLGRQLIARLDDVELVAYALDRLGVASSEELSARVDDCAGALADTIEELLPAAPWWRACCQAFRPDLDAWDQDLAITALKFGLMLRVLEDEHLAEREAGLPPDVEEALRIVMASEATSSGGGSPARVERHRAVLERVRQSGDRRPAAARSRRVKLPELARVLGRADEGSAPEGARYEWRFEDGQTVYLTLPHEIDAVDDAEAFFDVFGLKEEAALVFGDQVHPVSNQNKSVKIPLGQLRLAWRDDPEVALVMGEEVLFGELVSE